MDQLFLFDDIKQRIDNVCGKSATPEQIAGSLAGNELVVVPHANKHLAFLASAELLEYFRGAGSLPQGQSIIALYKKDLIFEGRFETSRSKPISFQGNSYYKNAEDDAFAASLGKNYKQKLERMAFTDDVAEALLASFGDALKVKVYWERIKGRQFGVDVTFGPNASHAICLQPKMTANKPYTSNARWLQEHEAMHENYGKLRRHNRLVRKAEIIDFIAVSNAEINPNDVERLKRASIGYFYLHTYQVKW